MPNSPAQSSAQVIFQQGRQARKDGNIVKAIDCFRNAIQLQPDFVPAYNNLANLLQDQGKIDEAIALYETAIGLAPNMAILHCNHASLLQLQDKIDLAIAGYHHALKLKPDFFLARHNLAKAYSAGKQLQRAASSYLDALQLQPNEADVHIELGHVYRQLGKLDKALESYKAAIRSTPSAQAYNCLGAILRDLGDNKLALTSYRRALKLDNDYEPAHNNLGLVLDETGELEAAQWHYQRSLELKPDAIKVKFSLDRVRLKLADWEDYDARIADLIASTETHLQDKPDEGLAAFGLLTFPLPNSLQTAVATQLAKSYEQAALLLEANIKPSQAVNPVTGRLRIGYVSPDFRGHAVGTLIHQMFQYHDRSQFEAFAYSLLPVDDEWTQSIRQGCEHFADISTLSPLAAAEHIQADGIHILVDLAGYTAHSMTTLFALKPAPVQVQYMGYPGTMGADFIPYIIADATIIPPELGQNYTEQVVYLPHAWVASPMEIAESAKTRKDYGLPETAVVYCCFNGTYKIELGVFRVWMRILQQVPGSVLWLGDGGRPIVAERLRHYAQVLGVEPNRLVFASNLPHADYLARNRLADLFLDTFIYNAGATAVGAFWSGLPVLTCPGETYVSRMGASLCHALDMPELVCTSVEDYEHKAILLGNNPTQIAILKSKLAQALVESPLFQPQLFVLSLEKALLALWQECVGHS